MMMDDETQTPPAPEPEMEPVVGPGPEPVPVQEPVAPVDPAVREAVAKISNHFDEWFPENPSATQPVKYLSAEWHYVRDAFQALKEKFSE